jgi:putative transcriptional regulator
MQEGTSQAPAANGAGGGLARHLLCAVPQLQDPNFRRSVVLVLEHGDEGALGLVVNNPLENTVADVARGLGLRWCGDENERIRLGGPVETARGWIVHDDAAWDPTSTELFPGVRLTTSLEPVNQAGHTELGGPGTRFLFLLGYAGWGGAQLEGEIAAGSWVAIPVRDHPTASRLPGVGPRFILDTAPEAMWDEALRSIGIDPARLVGLHHGGGSEMA